MSGGSSRSQVALGTPGHRQFGVAAYQNAARVPAYSL